MPIPNKGSIDCSWVWTEEHVLLARYFLRHAKINTDPNRCIVPFSGETKTKSSTESLNTEPINFISGTKVEYGTDDNLLTISYKYAIDAIQQFNNIIDNNIIIGKMFLIPRGEDVDFMLTSLTNSRRCSLSIPARDKLLTS